MAEEFEGGELLVTGGTDWAHIGRTVAKGKKDDPKEAARAANYPNLDLPHRIKCLMGVKIKLVAAGSAACHTIIADAGGRAYTWGRNEKGQLGHGDLVQRNVPTPVAALEGMEVVAAAAGRGHSVVITAEGKAYAFGTNQYGQLGTGLCKSTDKVEEMAKSPVECRVPSVQKVACGAEFTMFLGGGELFACGLPQYGQLGNGSDLQYNKSASSVKMAFEPVPLPVKVRGVLADKKVVALACGHNHTVAVDSEGSVYSWGFGGYGRLGHSVQQDEMSPKQIETFKGRLKADVERPVVACGSVTSFCASNMSGQLFSWGRMKATGDNTMYPKAFQDLSGWDIRTMACGNLTYAVGSATSTITWGAAQNGELGYGPNGRKSAACPDKCLALEGFTTHQVACGIGHMCFIVTHDEKDKIEKLPVWDNTNEEEPPEAEAGKGAKASGGKGTKRKADEPAGKGGRGGGRGRGRGRGKK